MKSFLPTLTLILSALIIAACSSSPTGRSQLTLFSDAELNKMGASSFEEMKKEEKISQDKALNHYVQCVSSAITAQVGPEIHQGDWEVVVFDSEMVNAFALPGGKIGVYTGILAVAENQHQLAAIIGHEVGHVIADHANERISSNMLAQTSMMVADVVLDSYAPESRGMVMSGLGVGIQVGILMPYGRTHESEADIIGLELMAKSGFQPEQSVKLWENMAKQDKNSPPEFLSTHPANQTRINQLNEKMSIANSLYKARVATPNCPKP
jgi:predicted Zn-dependent protease